MTPTQILEMLSSDREEETQEKDETQEKEEKKESQEKEELDTVDRDNYLENFNDDHIRSDLPVIPACDLSSRLFQEAGVQFPGVQ